MFKQLRHTDVKFDENSFVSLEAFLKTLEDNDLTVGLTIPKFVSTLLGPIGAMGLMALEDYDHFVAWIMSSVFPNTVISTNIFRNVRDSHKKLIKYYTSYLLKKV